MGFILMLIVGGLIGWLAGVILGKDIFQAVLLVTLSQVLSVQQLVVNY